MSVQVHGLHMTLGCLILLVLLGCAVEQGTVQIKGGKPYGVTSSDVWRGRWWNYYERGVSYAEGEFWDEAIRDLQEALKQRDSDQRRARTYGLHFVEEYFPHRELGVVYVRLGRYAEAIAELQTSLRQTESSKAQFYLNKARRGQLEQSKHDTAPPRLTLTSPRDGLLHNAARITLRGIAEDDTYVASVTINGRAEFIELAAPRVDFARELILRDGVQTIAITATDLLGKTTRQQLTVTLDRQGPLVSVGTPERLGAGQRVRVDGSLADTSGVVRFTLAGRQIPTPPGTAWDFREEVPLAPGMMAIPFEAEDAVGNLTRGEIPLTVMERASTPGLQQGAPPLLPRWASLVFGTILSDLGQYGAVPRHLSYRVAQSPGSQPPVIKVKSPAAQHSTYYDTVYIEGEVDSRTSPVTLLTMNDEPLLRVEKPRIFFGYNATLQEGENRFVVEAVNKAGNKVTRDIVVTRRVSQVKQRNARLKVALIPLKKQGQALYLADTADDYLFGALVNQERFKLVERSQLDKILQEQKLAVLSDAESAVKVGKLLQAEGMLFGSVTELEKPTHSLTALVRFVDVESSNVLVVKDVYGEDLSPPDVNDLMTGLVTKVRESFPLVQGAVLRADQKKVLVNLGRKASLKAQMKLLIFRCTGDDPAKQASTDEECDADTEVLDEAFVDEVSDERSQGTLRQGKAAIKEADRVITK